MADKEIWEIELEIKTAKIEAAQEKYNKFVKAREDGEKRIDDLGKKLESAGKNEFKQVTEESKAWEQAKREDKKRTAALENEYAKQQIANINRIADAQKKADSLTESLAADRLRKAAKQNEFNSQFKGQTSGIENYGITNLNGQIGSASYISQLKSIRSELNPTSAEFQQLSNSIKLYQAELDKVNKSSGIQSFKSLTLAIKETKGELARLAAEQKVGTAEWQKYSDKLRELQRQKQLIQRETKLTSQQLLAMSRDFTVVSFGVRQVITDIAGLSEGKKTAGELAMAISGIGLQVLTILPAIHGLTKALEAAGLVSTATIARLAALSSTLGTVAGGIAAVGAAYGIMAGAITHVSDISGRLSQVLSGQIGYWEAVKENIKDVTFGLLDFTAASNDFDSSKVQQQLADLAYLANFTANSFADLKQKVQDALNVNISKYLEYARTNKLPDSFLGPEPPNGHNPGYYDDNGTWHEGVKPPSTKKGGSPGNTKKEKDAIDELIQKVRDEIEIQKDLGKLNLAYLISEQDILKAADDTNLTLKQRAKLLKEIGVIQSDIAKWLLNGNGPIGDSFTGQSMYDKLFKNPTGDTSPFKKFIRVRTGQGGDNRPDMNSDELKSMIDMMRDNEQFKLGASEKIWSNFKGMLSDTELMKGNFGQIIAIIDSLINTGKSAYSLVDSILSFIPGGSIASGVIGTISGGGISTTQGGGMSYNGGSMPNIGMPNRQQKVTVHNHFHGELSAVGAWKTLKKGNQLANERGDGVI